ncbi:uncharacterized protein KD926_005251 [Aspergillus affinis]|uniref:uncharacterized protein n=1 Tax=Aspergillus affinis TaxID=1070780 RepID=UPI0022FDC63A|nr:uncharacterized protein KD926_005251 [Aspergillus affinis]KAI9042645.1 hypothetical protein KD926_005251 [Aspergillus affinis]
MGRTKGKRRDDGKIAAKESQVQNQSGKWCPSARGKLLTFPHWLKGRRRVVDPTDLNERGELGGEPFSNQEIQGDHRGPENEGGVARRLGGAVKVLEKRHGYRMRCTRRKTGVGSLGVALADQKTPGRAKMWDNQYVGGGSHSSCRRRISPATQAKPWRPFLSLGLVGEVSDGSVGTGASVIVTRSLVGLNDGLDNNKPIRVDIAGAEEKGQEPQRGETDAGNDSRES